MKVTSVLVQEGNVVGYVYSDHKIFGKAIILCNDDISLLDTLEVYPLGENSPDEENDVNILELILDSLGIRKDE